MKRNGGIRLAIIMGIICVILMGMSGALVFGCFQMKSELEKSAQQIEELKKVYREKKQEVENLRAEVEGISGQLDSLQLELDEIEMVEEEINANADGGEISWSENELTMFSMDELEPGTTIAENDISLSEYDNYFKVYGILENDEVYSRIIGKSYQINDNLGLEDLRYIKLLHYNFDGEIQVGEMIVSASLVEDFRTAFQKLFENKYQIQSMYLIDNYWTGDADSTDTASIDVNNTSCFNYRLATGGSSLSKHAYGCAIDINPQQNPYVWYDGEGNPVCAHDNAYAYIDRSTGAEHMITYDDLCYQVFTELGFTWGGDWDSPKDYQHFEKAVY